MIAYFLKKNSTIFINILENGYVWGAVDNETGLWTGAVGRVIMVISLYMVLVTIVILICLCSKYNIQPTFLKVSSKYVDENG